MKSESVAGWPLQRGLRLRDPWAYAATSSVPSRSIAWAAAHGVIDRLEPSKVLRQAQQLEVRKFVDD